MNRVQYFSGPRGMSIEEVKTKPGAKTLAIAEKIEIMYKDGIEMLQVTFPEGAELFLELIDPGSVERFEQREKWRAEKKEWA